MGKLTISTEPFLVAMLAMWNFQRRNQRVKELNPQKIPKASTSSITWLPGSFFVLLCFFGSQKARAFRLNHVSESVKLPVTGETRAKPAAMGCRIPWSCAAIRVRNWHETGMKLATRQYSYMLSYPYLCTSRCVYIQFTTLVSGLPLCQLVDETLLT